MARRRGTRPGTGVSCQGSGWEPSLSARSLSSLGYFKYEDTPAGEVSRVAAMTLFIHPPHPCFPQDYSEAIPVIKTPSTGVGLSGAQHKLSLQTYSSTYIRVRRARSSVSNSFVSQVRGGIVYSLTGIDGDYFKVAFTHG